MHTQGEWKRSDTCFVRWTTYRGKATGGRAFITNSESGLIAEVQGDTQEEAQANANLISAAPDMYEALREIKELLTKNEAAKLVKVCERTIRRWIRSGKLKVITLPSGRVRISTDELLGRDTTREWDR